MTVTTPHIVARSGLFIAGFLACVVCAYSQPSDLPPPPKQPTPDAKATERVMLENWVNQTASENDPDYTRLFTELGLKPDERERFKSQLADLHRKAIAAGEPMAELVRARVAFDKEIHAALGDDQYQRYREYEESKPARREYELLREFATKSNNLAIDPAFSEKIVRLIKNAKATTTETWHGPYDPRPHPEVGQQMVLVNLIRQLSELRQASSNLVQALPKGELPNDYLRLLKDYYSWKVDEMEKEIAFFSLTEEEIRKRRRQELEKVLEELRQRKQSSSPNVLF
jgi:hypothetical protein